MRFTIDELDELILYTDHYIRHNSKIMEKLKKQKEKFMKEEYQKDNRCRYYNQVCKHVEYDGNMLCNYVERNGCSYMDCKYFGR